MERSRTASKGIPSLAIQLTPEQEKRIQAMVHAGSYPSSEEALNAALAAVETAAELDGLLMEGLSSMELREEEFWALSTVRPTLRLPAANPDRVREGHLPPSIMRWRGVPTPLLFGSIFGPVAFSGFWYHDL